MALASPVIPAVKTIDEAARHLKLSRRTIQRWLTEGKLTAYRIEGDRRRYVDPDEIRRLREPRALSKG
ncbi:MAG: excisionase family DNA-binding protein [Candidatus Dormibacteraceae bacterium]